MTRSRRRNPRGQGEKLRDEILAAAFCVLDEHGGPGAVTLRAVARAAGVTAPAIYGHFSSVEELLAAMRARVFADLDDAMADASAQATDPIEQLLAHTMTYVEAGIRAPARRQLMFTVIAGAVNLAGEATFRTLVRLVRTCVAAGRCGSTSPDTDAVLLLAALDGLVQGHVISPAFPWPPLADSVRLVTTRLLQITL